MSGIRVTPEQLQAISSQLTSGAGNIDSMLAQLASQVAPLGSDWAGVAQARFEALWLDWQNGAKQIHEALVGIADLTQKAALSYDQTEQSVAGSFGA